MFWYIIKIDIFLTVTLSEIQWCIDVVTLKFNYVNCMGASNSVSFNHTSIHIEVIHDIVDYTNLHENNIINKY